MLNPEDDGYDATKGDVMSEIDQAIGPLIERTIQKWLPRERLRDVRKSTVKHIADAVMPPAVVPITPFDPVKDAMKGSNGEMASPARGETVVADLALIYRRLVREFERIKAVEPEIFGDESVESQSKCRG